MADMTLAEFFAARLDEGQALAQRMLDGAEPQVWPWEVWVTPGIRSDAGEWWDVEPSVATAEYMPKAYRRLWACADSDYPHADDGWCVHESAICVWSQDVAARMLRDIEAKRKVLDAYTDALEAVAGIKAGKFLPPGIEVQERLEHELDTLYSVVYDLASVFSGHPDWREDLR